MDKKLLEYLIVTGEIDKFFGDEDEDEDEYDDDDEKENNNKKR